MSNNGSLSVNYNIDGNNITFKDVEVFSNRPIDFSHPLALGTSRMASIRLKENNLNDDNDKELGVAKKFLNNKQLLSNLNFSKDELPVAEASVVDDSIPEAEAVADEDGKQQFKNEGTIAEGGPQYPEGEAGTEVNEEPHSNPIVCWAISAVRYPMLQAQLVMLLEVWQVQLVMLLEVWQVQLVMLLEVWQVQLVMLLELLTATKHQYPVQPVDRLLQVKV
jgi:hypothetical protein